MRRSANGSYGNIPADLGPEAAALARSIADTMAGLRAAEATYRAANARPGRHTPAAQADLRTATQALAVAYRASADALEAALAYDERNDTR